MKSTLIKIVICILLLQLLTGNLGITQTIEPTDEEQLMLELINRARMAPPAEGMRLANHQDSAILNAYRYFNVDLEAVKEEFNAYPPRPPLTLNLNLIQAARRHSIDMRDNKFQDHYGSDGSDPGQRIEEAGYDWRGYGENVFAHGENVEHAHAAFLVDWNVPSLGHRKNTLEFDREPLWKEVGIGIVQTVSAKVMRSKIRLKKNRHDPKSAAVGTKQLESVGPLLVTIDFAVSFQYTPQILGVVYADTDQNQFYDIGEGLGGVTITVKGTNQSTNTYSSGGYTIPIADAGQYTLEASGGPLPEPMTKTFTFDGENNVKIDFILGDDTEIMDWSRF